MQVIWSRTAQTRSCRCHSCLHAATALARRTTTVASRRRLKASDVFTACYSAMFATAALVDMKFKNDRRRQWDAAIAQAKSYSNVALAERPSPAPEGVACDDESEHLDPQRPVLYKPLSASVEPERGSRAYPASSGWDAAIAQAKSYSNVALAERPSPAPEGVACDDESEHLDPQRPVLYKALSVSVESEWGSRAYPASSEWDTALRDSDPQRLVLLKPLPLLVEPEESLTAYVGEIVTRYAPRRRQRLRRRDPQNLEHLEYMQRMVLKLVASFLVDKETLPAVPENATHTHKDREREVRKILEHQFDILEASGIPRPCEYTGTNMYEERKLLNNSIMSILEKDSSDPADFESAVAKVCYNLLASSAPPNIDTYNIMLIRFTRLKQHRHAQAVVDSFFEDSKFKPNSHTIAAMLDHYAAKGDPGGFRSIVQRMKGLDGGMNIRSRSISDVNDLRRMEWTANWAKYWKITAQNYDLHAKVPRNQMIFYSLIVGSLHLFGITRAVTYLCAALREGCHVGKDLFIQVARMCISKPNKNAAIQLLKGVVSQWQLLSQWQPYIKLRGLETYSESRGAIFELMEFVGLEHSINFDQRYRRILNGFDDNIYESWICAINLEVLGEHSRRSAKCISGLEFLLAAASSGAFTAKVVVPWMLEVIDCHPISEPQRESGALVAAVELVTDGFSRRCKNLEAQLSDIVYTRLSADSREECQGTHELSSHVDTTMVLESAQNLYQTRPEIEEGNALEKGRTHQVPDSVNSPEIELLKWNWLATYCNGCLRMTRTLGP